MSKAILGGGLSGLSAAYYLSKKFPNQTHSIFEATPRTGGWIKSNLQKNDVIFEQGPRTIRPRGEAGLNTLNLIKDLCLTHDIVPISSMHPVARNRLIYAKQQLHLLPSSLIELFRKQKLFTKPLIFHLLKDLREPKKVSNDDSIYEFVNRRFGQEVADYLISPLICGICAGNAKEISVHFLMKQLFEYEQEHGSISKGIVKNIFRRKEPEKKISSLGQRAKIENWNVYSFVGGCETLPLTLSCKVKENGVDINLTSECKEIVFNLNEVILKFNNCESYKADHVLSCIPAKCLAPLVGKQHPALASLLKELTKNVSVAVINLHFDKKLLKDPAFGFLVAPKERLPILGVIYDSCCFPPKDNNSTVLTVMMGGYWFEKHFGTNPSEEMLLEIAIAHIQTILNFKDEPVQYKVNVLHQCLPQYVVGHNQKLKRINQYIKNENLPISLCGASYYGVGVNDVILSAKNAVDELYI